MGGCLAEVNKGRKTLGIDVDSTLAESMETFINIYNRKYRKTAKLSDLMEYDLTKSLGISKAEMRAIFEETWHEWKKIPIVDSRIPGYVNSLAEKYYIKIITYNDTKDANLKKWLSKHGIQYEEIVYEIPESKWMHCDAIVDDYPKVIDAADRMGKLCIFLRKPWSNQAELELSGRVLKLSNWSEIYGHLISKEVYDQI